MLPIVALKEDLIKSVGLMGPQLVLKDSLITMHLTQILKVSLIYGKVGACLMKVLHINWYLLISILLLLLLLLLLLKLGLLLLNKGSLLIKKSLKLIDLIRFLLLILTLLRFLS
jgi:hypothetical protein